MENQQQARNPVEEIRATLGKMGSQFKAVLPTQAHVDRYIRVVMTAVQQNPDLAEPEARISFYAACMKCAQDGLMPDGKEAVLKIYNNKVGADKWVKTVGYEPMVEGLLKKLRLSGEIVGAPKVHVVYANDEFTYELGDNERIVHKPALSNRGEIVAAYSIVKLKSGDTSREVMSRDEIDGIMQRSKSKDRQGNIVGPWKTDYSEMCRKTVFKRHYKRLPRSSDLDNVIQHDNEENGIETETGTQIATTTRQDAPQATPPGPRRSPALAAIAEAGGTPAPTQQPGSEPVTREPVTIDQPAAQGNGGPPADII